MDSADFQMCGAWILPDGGIHWTNNIQSHRKIIEELGIREKLVGKMEKMRFSAEEIGKHLENDLSYVALKLGYLRITCFRNQFSMECCGKVAEKLKLRSVAEVYLKISRDEFREHGILMDNFVLEDFPSGKTRHFGTFDELMTHLKSQNSNI